MIAVKENKVYTIDENSKNTYLSQGFSICDDSGKVTEYPKTATVSREEYEKVLAELAELKSKKGKSNVSES